MAAMILSCTALKTPGVLLSAFSTPIGVSLIRMGVASRLRMGAPRYPRSGAYFKEYGASRTSATLNVRSLTRHSPVSDVEIGTRCPTTDFRLQYIGSRKVLRRSRI